MRFKNKSWQLHEHELKQKIQDLQEWHKSYIIFPRRFMDNHVHVNFMCRCMRKLRRNYKECTASIKAKWGQGNYEYKSLQDYITEKLMNK